MTSSTWVSPTHNDFRSDTFTAPSPDIIAAASVCSLGDDDYGEDRDTADLGAYVAKLAGKEAGLYCTSGVMSNQIGLRALLNQPPYSILMDHRSHIINYEAAGLAMLCNAMVAPVVASNGAYLTLEDVQKHAVLSEEHYFATTRVVSLENTLNGTIMPYEEIKRISKWCREKGIKVHLDGARLWNASVATGVSLSDYSQLFDTVSLCLSKGIGAPIGSVIVGDKETIRIAKRFRKQLGGSMRQAGVISSMATVALKQNFPAGIKRSHELAKEVGDFCNKRGIRLHYPVHTNFVWLSEEYPVEYFTEFARIAKDHGIVVSSGNRVALHYQISLQSLEILKKTLAEVFGDFDFSKLADKFSTTKLLQY